jgi:hypothetical protein
MRLPCLRAGLWMANPRVHATRVCVCCRELSLCDDSGILAATLARVEPNWTGTISSDSLTADNWTAGCRQAQRLQPHRCAGAKDDQ